MRPLIASIDAHTLRKGLLVALGCGALAVLSGRAHADDAYPAQITITAPKVKVVGRNADLTPIEERTATAQVPFEPVTLTTNSGVALLKDRVREAAHRVCTAADPEDIEDDETCVMQAIKAADPQVNDAIARAKSSSNEG